jgi:hypothetical protein
MKTIILKVEVSDDFPIDNNISFWIEMSGADSDGDRLYITGNAKVVNLSTEEEIIAEASKDLKNATFNQGLYSGFINGANWYKKQITG